MYAVESALIGVPRRRPLFSTIFVVARIFRVETFPTNVHVFMWSGRVQALIIYAEAETDFCGLLQVLVLIWVTFPPTILAYSNNTIMVVES